MGGGDVVSVGDSTEHVLDDLLDLVIPLVELREAQVTMSSPGNLDQVTEPAGLFVALLARRIVPEVRARCGGEMNDARVSLELMADSCAGQALELRYATVEIGKRVERATIRDHRLLSLAPGVVERCFFERALGRVERGLEVREGDLVARIRPHAELLDQEARGFRHDTDLVAELVLESFDGRRLAGAWSAREHEERHGRPQYLVERLARGFAAELAREFREREIVHALRDIDPVLEPERAVGVEVPREGLVLDFREHDALERPVKHIDLVPADLVPGLGKPVLAAVEKLAPLVETDRNLRLLAHQSFATLVRDEGSFAIDDTHPQADAWLSRVVALLEAHACEAIEKSEILGPEQVPMFDLECHLLPPKWKEPIKAWQAAARQSN